MIHYSIRIACCCRSKTRILLSMIALLGIVGAMLVMAVSSRTTYAAAASAQFHGTPGAATRLSTSRPSLTNPTNAGGKRMIDTRIPARSVNGAAMLAGSSISSTALDRTEGSLLHNFNGLSDINQAAVNGGSGVGEGCRGTFVGTMPVFTSCAVPGVPLNPGCEVLLPLPVEFCPQLARSRSIPALAIAIVMR